jgi:hypothetical protein
MTDPHDDLIRRIRSRAENLETRTDAPPTTLGRTVQVSGLAATGLDLDKLLRGDPSPRPDAPGPLSPPASEAALADAEKRLGFVLPSLLRRLYAEVADGCFGPGGGILKLGDVVRTYDGLTPPGPRGQKWPYHLLPITRGEPGHDCVDVGTGAVIFWDEEELASGGSDKIWKRSFKPEATDLAAWLEKWVGTPSPEDKMKAIMEKAKLDSIRQTLAHWRAKTPAERAAFGLPETGWEEKLFGHLGIDLSKL